MTAFTIGSPFPLTNDELIDVTTNGYEWYFSADHPRVLNWTVSSSNWAHPTLQSPETQADFSRLFGFIAEFINVQFSFLGYIDGVGSKLGYQVAYDLGSNLNISYSFNGFTSTGQYLADNRFGNSTTATALCYFPDSDYNTSVYNGAPGDAWLNYNNPFIQSFTYETGTNGFALLLHEVLHGLGLKHPHDSGGTGRPTYTSLGIQFADRQWISVMSYDRFETGGDGAYSGSMPIGPMIFDAIALQYLYGESSFNSGDTNYNLASYVGNNYNCQWDASGIDTLDGSNLNFGLVADMGSVSESNGQHTHLIGFITSAIDYLFLSFQNPQKWTWLWGEYENFNGSNYADVVNGNVYDNVINGGGGDDSMSGGAGNDTFDWDPTRRDGNDTMAGGLGDDTYVLDSIFDVITELSFEGVDTVYTGFSYSLVGTALENVATFSNQSTGITLTGNTWGNRLTGGGGSDVLRGNEGDDTIHGGGGNDAIDGGTGVDTASFSGLRASYIVSRGTNSVAVNGTLIGEGTDSLVGVERLQFLNMNVALDLDGRAGTAVKLLGALVGPNGAHNPVYIGLGLLLFDAGWTGFEVADAALNYVLGPGHTNSAVVNLIYQSLADAVPPLEVASYYTGLLNSHSLTQAQLLVGAGDLALNLTRIGFVGLSKAGVDYVVAG